jgi:hypothetical protein
MRPVVAFHPENPQVASEKPIPIVHPIIDIANPRERGWQSRIERRYQAWVASLPLSEWDPGVAMKGFSMSQ